MRLRSASEAGREVTGEVRLTRCENRVREKGAAGNGGHCVCCGEGGREGGREGGGGARA
jgi:hypothetical protein